MGTKKKVIQCVIEDEYYEKFKEIQKIQKRKSESATGQYMIETYIDRWEKEYREIKIEE